MTASDLAGNEQPKVGVNTLTIRPRVLTSISASISDSSPSQHSDVTAYCRAKDQGRSSGGVAEPPSIALPRKSPDSGEDSNAHPAHCGDGEEVRTMKRTYGTLGVLVLALLLGLLLAAGPVSAGSPPPGSQWGGHEVNGWASIVNVDKSVTLQVVADDERVSGTMDVIVKSRWYDADGTGHQSGTFTLYNAAGSWRCSYWETVYFFNARSAEDPVQELLLNCSATGSGAYKGLIFVHSHHGAQGGPYILKGWILPAD